MDKPENENCGIKLLCKSSVLQTDATINAWAQELINPYFSHPDTLVA